MHLKNSNELSIHFSYSYILFFYVIIKKKIGFKNYFKLFLNLHELRITSLSVIHFESETYETNLFIKCTSIKKIKKGKNNTISIFNFIYIFHLDFR
jgi:hypothetical protein